MNIKVFAFELYASIRIPNKRRRSERVLVLVGMVESSHFQSWTRAIISEKFFDRIWIVPSDCQKNKLTIKSLGLNSINGCKIKVFQFPVGMRLNHLIFKILDLGLGQSWRSALLYKYIKKAKPDFLHFHELQHGAYLFNPISKYFDEKRNFKTICSTWGSDLLFYGELKSHTKEIEKIFDWTDLISAERIDDKNICDRFNYNKDFIAPVYITVGLQVPIELPKVNTSLRKKIIIKGYQDDHGRALNALAALEHVKMNLENFEIRIFSASQAVKLQVEFLKSTKNWDIEVIGKTSNQEIKKHFSEARIYIGLAISDGLSTSMVEAIANGAFPIQSRNSAAKIFIQDGISGFVVDPWDLTSIARNIDIALDNNELVDNAMKSNIATLEKSYNYLEGIRLIRTIYSN
jgi:glycosyltransferase involved in cell wall biosynthesis